MRKEKNNRGTTSGISAVISAETAAGVLMRLMRMTACTALSVLLTACSPGCVLERSGTDDQLVIVSWNVENLFNGEHDGTEYPEYDPDEGNWDAARYHVRLEEISRALLGTVPRGPDIICLQEIEHEGVIRDILEQHLVREGYRYYRSTAAPDSAIQQAVISRHPIVVTRIHGTDTGTETTIRPILEVSIDTGHGMITIFNNHWKSRRGGPEITEPLRIAAADTLERVVSELLRRHPERLVVAVGDLNTNADEYQRVSGAYPTALIPPNVGQESGLQVSGDPGVAAGIAAEAVRAKADNETGVDQVVFFNPWLDTVPEPVPGSYVYRGEWYSYDHIMCSAAAFDGRGWEFTAYSPDTRSDLMDEDGIPVSWDNRTGSGYSDHLPVILELAYSR